MEKIKLDIDEIELKIQKGDSLSKKELDFI